MQLPVVHLNGSNRETLQQEYYEAWKAVRAAQRAVGAVECHPRDYYVAGDHAWAEAHDARLHVLQKLQDVVEYLEMHVMHLA